MCRRYWASRLRPNAPPGDGLVGCMLSVIVLVMMMVMVMVMVMVM